MAEILTVYVAGPYTHGDTAEHVHRAVQVGLAIRRAGHVPFIPHLYHLAHLLCPSPYEFWMALDLAWLSRCDCVVRIPGHSPGAEREAEAAKAMGKPVYYNLDVFLQAHGPKPVRAADTITQLLEE